MTWSVHRLSDDDGEFEEYRLPAEKLIEGNPLQSIRMQYTDASNRFFAGIWRSEVGKWRISYTEEEYCEMLGGTSLITDDSGRVQRVSTGDRFVMPRGFTGTWEVVEPTTKRFVIFEPGIEAN
ncbi:MAG: cupin domain-containing protein [Pseudomonadales bacterium]